eukprot:gene37706-45807_t
MSEHTHLSSVGSDVYQSVIIPVLSDESIAVSGREEVADQVLLRCTKWVTGRTGATSVAILPSLYDLCRAEVFKQVEAGKICPKDICKFYENLVDPQFLEDLGNLVIKFTTPSPSATPQKQVEDGRSEESQHRPDADLVTALQFERLLRVTIDNQDSIHQMLKVAAEERKVAAEDRKAVLSVQNAMINTLVQLTESLQSHK